MNFTYTERTKYSFISDDCLFDFHACILSFSCTRRGEYVGKKDAK